MAFTLISVYPELLGTYGDGGNVLVLRRRLAWRGVPVEVVAVSAADPLPTSGDLYVFGDSADDHQTRALEGLRSSGLGAAVDRGAHVFAVCAGLQLLGSSMCNAFGGEPAGLGLLDLTSYRLPRRVIGEVVADVVAAPDLPALNGFANHAGGSRLGPAARPLARTRGALSNEGTAGNEEGAVQGNVVATYLHGPVLARNPTFADWLLERALGETLAPIDEGACTALHDERVRRSSRR